MAAGASPPPSCPYCWEEPAARKQGRPGSHQGPRYRAFSNTSILAAGLPAVLSPPLPPQKLRPHLRVPIGTSCSESLGVCGVGRETDLNFMVVLGSQLSEDLAPTRNLDHWVGCQERWHTPDIPALRRFRVTLSHIASSKPA